ncbi:helix-turn-helix transcriptional regulator [Levilactobacillus huananensis]|uniref:helix-turn-helix transcriptional regulator n=1 Tax=Levilactobacillus huananensis TaxID=2486019 RepID=UPI001CDD849B|nr:helix-turn-helix transcriptional regulator [Levilactobacillus huananensis]
MSLGTTIKQVRLQRHLTQREVAQDICAQSMLSAIENDRYTPNATLLMRLCERLAISLNEISLAKNFDVGPQVAFNQRVEELCNQHQYAELQAFLKQDDVIAAIDSDEQTQAYYYYLGVTEIQLGPDLVAAEQDFHLSLASAVSSRATTLTRIAQMSLALVRGRQQRQVDGQKLVTTALTDLANSPYEENLNILFYLAALFDFEAQRDNEAMQRLIVGIQFATDHNSHYLLANDYHLLAVIAERSERLVDENYHQSEKLLTKLFHEKIYDRF